MTPAPGLTVQLLGPFAAYPEPRAGDRGISPREKALLARLAIDVGHVVPASRLIDDLWADSPPASASNAIQVYVSHLRAQLGRDLIISSGSGYALATSRESVDVHVFDRLVSDAALQLQAGRAKSAATSLDDALQLWRGEPLSDLSQYEFARVTAAWLNERRLTAVEYLAEALLACGEHDRVVAELAPLVGEFPFREQLRAAVMTGLYRQGRAVDALESYGEARALLRDEFGLDPGPALKALQAAILVDDPRLILTTALPGNLPVALTELVGRGGEIAKLRALVVTGARLVTLTGPGGAGKSRLAAGFAGQTAADYPNGAFFVPLAMVTDVAGMWTAIAQVLGLPPVDHHSTGVTSYLRHRRVLLVLDNLEQLPAASIVVDSIVSTAGEAVVIATSQRPVRVVGEIEHPVPLLLLPDLDGSTEDIAASDAVEMFVQYAARVRPGFVVTDENAPAVAALCRALDGLPLAIELAAARVKLLTPAAILARLDGVLDLAARDAGRPDRQRTLRKTVEWSFDLLDPVHQQVLAQLGVFVGGARVDAVREVVSVGILADLDVLEILSDLVDASLVVVSEDFDAEPRFSLLETIRRYMLDWLAGNGLRSEAEEAHAQYYYVRADALYASRHGGGELFIEPFSADLYNFGELIRRSDTRVDEPRAPEGYIPTMRLTRLLIELSWCARHYSTALDWANIALSRQSAAESDLGTVDCLAGLGFLHSEMSNYDESIATVERALALMATIEVKAEEPVPLEWWVNRDAIASGVYFVVAIANLNRDDFIAAGSAADLAIFHAKGGPPTLYATALSARLDVYMAIDDWSRAAEILELVHASDLETGESGYDRYWYLVTKVVIEIGQGLHRKAHGRATEFLDDLIAFNDPVLIASLAEGLVATLGVSGVELAARTHGSIARFRTTHGIPAPAQSRRMLDRDRARHQDQAESHVWDLNFGRGTSEDLISLMREITSDKSARATSE